MSINVQGELPLSPDDVERLWREVVTLRKYISERDAVTVRVVSFDEIQRLNREYRGKDMPTNVLTFSYPPDAAAGVPASEQVTEHDIVVCSDVAQAEAEARGAVWRDYAALLLAHAFLHATGLDHEESEAAAEEMRLLEQAVLREAGFSADTL